MAYKLSGIKQIEGVTLNGLEKEAKWFVDGIRSGTIKVKNAIIGIEKGKFVWKSGNLLAYSNISLNFLLALYLFH